jgi:hypothetical protein
MSEQDDKPLHDWVRQSLHSYRPDYNAQDWKGMQQRLRRRRWWRTGLFSIASLGALLLIGLYIKDAHSPQATTTHKGTTITGAVEPGQKSIITDPTPPKVSERVPTDRATNRTPVIQKSPASLPTENLAVALVQPHSQVAPLATNLSALDFTRLSVAFSSEETAIQQQMLTASFGDDSTSYQTLARNLNQWRDAVVVCDLTTSMYPYSTQLFAWVRKQARNPSIKGFVFFTDCDSLGQQTRPNGLPGQMFVTHEYDATKALPTLLKAARNTIQNDDNAENDVEALVFAQKAFPTAKHLILIADNMSTVKDMHLLTKLALPVHVILCGTTGSTTALPFQQDYHTIASQTNGSLHTLEDDFEPDQLSNKSVIRVGAHYYRYNTRKKRFKVTDFDHRPIRVLGILWL